MKQTAAHDSSSEPLIENPEPPHLRLNADSGPAMGYPGVGAIKSAERPRYKPKTNFASTTKGSSKRELFYVGDEDSLTDSISYEFRRQHYPRITDDQWNDWKWQRKNAGYGRVPIVAFYRFVTGRTFMLRSGH